MKRPKEDSVRHPVPDEHPLESLRKVEEIGQLAV